MGTAIRNRVWTTDETLWADAVAKSPGNARAWMNYGLTQMSRGRYVEAQRHFRRAAAITPNYSYLETNLGIVTVALGDTLGAEAHFRRAIALEPEQPGAYFFYGRYLVRAGRGLTPSTRYVAPLRSEVAGSTRDIC